MKFLFVCNDLRYFLAHRAVLAKTLLAKGHEVVVASGDASGMTGPDEAGFRIVPLNLDMHRFRPLSDLALVWSLARLVRGEKPDIVHTITAKPNLFGSLALILLRLVPAKRPALVMTFPGLGKIYEPGTGLWHGLRGLAVTTAYGFARRVNDPVATTENADDAQHLVDRGIVGKGRATAIVGSGVDMELYSPAERSGTPTILFAGRLLAGKGVRLFLRAAGILRPDFPDARFVLAGPIDESNPDSVPLGEIEAAVDRGDIAFLGHVDPAAMPDLLRSADIFCMPSLLREGLPRVIIEAAACGCYVIASDQRAIGQVVRHAETGVLFDTGDQSALNTALCAALEDIAATRQRGRIAADLMRELPVSQADINAAFIDVYRSAAPAFAVSAD